MRALRRPHRDQLLEALHDEHGAALLRYARRLTGDRQRAEDVVQETLLRAWRNADELTGDAASLRPWLFRVAHNVAIDQRRALGGAPDATEEALARLPVEDQLDRQLDAWQVAAALRRLSDDHRAVLLETFYRGRTVAEAGRVLGIPAGTVKSRTYYALRALRLELEEQGWGG
jgi:RNA polymerase sigma-70 factor (ECF subfamily)